MKELTKEDILKNHVDTISQFKVLKYLKFCLNVDYFKLYLIDKGIKVVDTKKDTLYFYYDDMTNDVITTDEELTFDKSIDIEL